MTGPYGVAAGLYRAAGWPGVLPLPAGAKWPPPGGYTGWAGVDPSGADVQAWLDGPEAAGNVALRLPQGVFGLDVDDYGSKSGGAALGELVERLGRLPATWLVTSRGESASGIRLFRADLEVGRRWRDEPAGHGAGIEAIHLGHRYAVVWPSVHPETGRKYTWWRPDGLAAGDGEVPRVGDLPALPAAWVEALSEPGEVATGEQASHADTVAAVSGFPGGEGEPCSRMREAGARALARLREAANGAALHPAGRDGTHELVRLGHEGHAGARRALAEHYVEFVAVRAGREGERGKAEAEWWRLVRGAVGKLVGPAHEGCDCGLLAGEGVQFDAPLGVNAREDARDESSGGDGGAGGESPIEAMRRELLTPAQVAARANPVPLVAGLLDMDTLAWLIGKSGSFKSFVALDIAGHVATGETWAHRRVRQGAVLYVAAEGAAGMTLRVRAWQTEHGPMPDSVLILPRPVQAKGAEWATLVEVCRQVRPALIVVDTQARVTIGIEENSNTDMGAFVEQVDRLRRSCGACVLMVHHIGRNGEDARGASSIDGAQDTELKVERVGGPRAMRARLLVDKQKDGADTAAVNFEMARIDGGEDPETGRDLSSLVVRVTDELFAAPSIRPWFDELGPNQAKIIDVMFDHLPETGGTYAQVLALVNERFGAQFPAGKMPKASFSTAWQRLIKLDKIGRVHGTQRYELISMDMGSESVRTGDKTGIADIDSSALVRS